MSYRTEPVITVYEDDEDDTEITISNNWILNVGGEAPDKTTKTIWIWNNRGGADNIPYLYNPKLVLKMGMNPNSDYAANNGWIKAKVGSDSDSGSYVTLGEDTGLSFNNMNNGSYLSGVSNDGELTDSTKANRQKVTIKIDPSSPEIGVSYQFEVVLKGYW